MTLFSRHATSRRQFFKTSAAVGAAAGAAQLAFLGKLPAVSAAHAARAGNLSQDAVKFLPEIEPLVKLIEDSPRETVLQRVAEKIRGGTSYEEVLTALLLAGIRNVQPRPSVGFKFHAVLVVNSAHVASVSGPKEHRWLPIFWSIDNFKTAQAQDVREGNWTMPALADSAVPSGQKAIDAFSAAMDAWDEAAADVAAAGLARSFIAGELPDAAVFDVLARYGARDFRSIGHKAIYVANSWRTMEVIGKQHAEPIIRSLAYAMLNHEGEGNPAQNDFAADRPGRRNASLAEKFPAGWLSRPSDEKATLEMLGVLRSGTPEDACDKVMDLVNSGVGATALWDAMFLGSGELLFRQRGIVALHAATSTNALRYAFNATKDDSLKRMLLLQNAAFVALFRGALQGRGEIKDVPIEELKPAPLYDKNAAPRDIAQEIFSTLGGDRMLAARKAQTAIASGVSAKELIDAGRLLVFLKGTDSHDYKFSSAVLEDFAQVSPRWQDRFMAASVYNLHAVGEQDNTIVKRVEAAFAG